MNVSMTVIPHEDQRYPTVGDWQIGENNHLDIRVSKMSDWRFEALVQFHEYIEAVLCELEGVTQQQVDAFDMAYEAARPPGDVSEPGDDPKAPYRLAHFRATNLERVFADMLGVNWAEYEKELDSM